MERKWGVFDKRSAVHTAPCTEDGYIEFPHELSVECQCRPEIEWDQARPLVKHRCFGCQVASDKVTQ